MRIIEAPTEAQHEYRLARVADISCTVRPYRGFPAEDFVTHYAGPPALIMWHETSKKENIGWAIPYTTLERRAANSIGLMNLDAPKLVYIAVPNGFGTGFQWLSRFGAKTIGPRDLREDKDALFLKHSIDTIFTTPAFCLTLMEKDMGFIALRRVVIFVGCEVLSADELKTIRAFFGTVEVTMVYWRAWAGIISMNSLGAMLDDPLNCGEAVADIDVGQTDAGELFCRGANVEGVQILTSAGPVARFGWVPLLNRGFVERNRVFVEGTVA